MFERADAAALGRVQIERDGLVHEACVSELLGSTLQGGRITRLRCLFLHDAEPNRLTSPVSARMTSAVNGPTPGSRVSTLTRGSALAR